MNKYEIIWTPKAIKDIETFYNYIAYNLKEISIANNILKKIINSISSLDYLPERFLKIHNYHDSSKNLRRILVNNYVIIYEINKNIGKIYILHIFHKNQDYFNLL